MFFYSWSAFKICSHHIHILFNCPFFCNYYAYLHQYHLSYVDDDEYDDDGDNGDGDAGEDGKGEDEVEDEKAACLE